MADGPSFSFDNPAPTGESLRPLDELPQPVMEMLSGLGNEMAALELKPRFPVNGEEKHSFREGLIQNARVIWTFRNEIARELRFLTGDEISDEDIVCLVKAAILTDMGKVGTEPVKEGEIPQNLTARIYREFRWEKIHADRSGKGRTTIPFGEAVEVMRLVALEKYPEAAEEVNRIFSLSEEDKAELEKFGLSTETPLARVFTAQHCKANGELLPKLKIGIPERDYASGHHFPAGIDLLPKQVIDNYQLKGEPAFSKPFVRYVANAAMLTATDRIQGFMQRSGKSSFEAQQVTIMSILTKDIDANFANHRKKDVIKGMFASVLGCVTKNKLADYYAAN